MSDGSSTTPPSASDDGVPRRRSVASSNPASDPSATAATFVYEEPPSYPVSPALQPVTPPFRPVFSRRSTDSGSSTTSPSPRFEIPDDDPLFSGLSLLDLLNVFDAHIELLTRPLRRKSSTWKSKADKLLDEAKQKGRETFKVPSLPSVPAFDLGEGMGFRGERDREAGRDGGEKRVLSQKDKERIERKYREMRGRMRDSVAKLVIKWEEEKTVRLRDKISFLCGVMNVLVSALLLGFHPSWIPDWYSLQMLFYTPYRIFTYKRKLYHYFLFDLCYFVNLLSLLYLWVFPGSTFLFEACYGLTLGSLGTAIATWRNSLVFHSLDKVISLAIHIFPPFVFTVIRHFYPEDLAFKRYPALAKLPHLRPWRSMAICMVTYTIWQLLYFHFVIQLRAEKIKEGRATSFTFMINDKKRLIGKIAARVPPAWREPAFIGGQAIYTFVTLIPPLFFLYDSKFWSSVYLLLLFAVSAYNGASFYPSSMPVPDPLDLSVPSAASAEGSLQGTDAVARKADANGGAEGGDEMSTALGKVEAPV
ncbi:hypothetical protein Rhopal_003507-T1 [Rhodotorula paludigena]|uniref:Glycerophosphocholine acyltransferase 1 n=1 Tax=Rhodotorula paludigena TaxID=86838 RepID=A0AAV5GD83_9BASI|nr:hypothetical protein Rhopal_003507-T1 [Rhodotorula paludigena]